MASSINADNGVVSGSSGVKTTADTSGVLALQSNGTTGLTLNTTLAIGVGSSPSYGSANQVLISAGSGAAPTWGAVPFRVVVIADGTSITMNADTTDMATQANTQAAGTLTINAPTGTLSNGQKLILRLLSTNVQTFSWNAVFAGSTDVALPTASSGSSKYDYMGFIYNSTATKWQMIAKNFGF